MPLTSKHQQWLSLKWLKKSKQRYEKVSALRIHQKTHQRLQTSQQNQRRRRKRLVSLQVEVQPTLTGLTTSNAPGNDHTTMSDYEQGQLIFMKIDQERIR